MNEPTEPRSPAPDDATRIVSASRAPANEATAPGGRPVAPAARTVQHLEAGRLIAHTYEIEALLGRGGMGEVYRARHVKLNSLHAIKVIAPELVDDERVIEMFTEEARKLRRVRHDAVVSYDGMIGDQDGLLYLIMEFVDGVSLAKVIRERALAPEELRALRDRLAQGLGAAHDKLIYHRDISPDNIILVNGMVDQAKIIDFGIAKSGATGDRTIIGNDFAGKFSWVSPEQLGMFGGQVDGRSDIFSLGLVLAAAGRGQALDMGSSPAMAVQARQHVPDLSPLDADLRAEIEPLLEPDPANRPATMRDLPRGVGSSASPQPATRFAAAQAATRVAPSSEGAFEPRATPRSSSLPLILAGAALLITLGSGAAYLFWPSTPTSTASRASPSQPAAPVPSPAPPPIVEANSPPAATLVQSNATVAAPQSAPNPPLPAPSRPENLAVLPPPATVDARTLGNRLTSFAHSLGCADLKPSAADQTNARLTGFVTGATARSRLIQMVQDIPSLEHGADAITVRPWPQCDQAIRAVRDSGTVDDPALAPELAFNVPSRDYRLGDKLVLRVTTTANVDGFLYVDFMDSKGSLAHLLPRPNGPTNAVHAGQTVTLGDAKDSALEIAEPLGPNLVLAIFSPQRLLAPRADEEAQQYFPVLSRALSAAASGPQATRPSVTYAFVYALPGKT
ncbi:MAG TPA: serine/threonine-protein kinase [Stellaceae bacterium]|nr:serine/threonine-protein kinase [Stellaceae bacterium]